MTELDLKQIREDALASLRAYEKTTLISEADARTINKHVTNVTAKNTLALLDRLEKAERAVKVDAEYIAFSQENDERLCAVIKERDAQLKVCVEALKEIRGTSDGERFINIPGSDCSWIAKEALEKVGVV